MEFLSWWFDTHYIWSTLLTPGFTALWCIFKGGMVWRMVTAILLSILVGGVKYK